MKYLTTTSILEEKVHNMLGLIQKRKNVKTNFIHTITINIQNNRIEVWIDYKPITEQVVKDTLLVVIRFVAIAILRVLIFINENMQEVQEFVNAFSKIVSSIFRH